MRDIPADIAISATFVAVFLLAFIPSTLLLLSPDLLLAIKNARDELKGKPPRGG
jgi:hypothetical protein